MPDPVEADLPREEGNWLTREADAPVRSIVFSAARIRDRVREMAGEITSHYASEEDLLVLGLLKGSFIFVADLVRWIERPIHVDFIVASSYGSGRRTSGEVSLLYDPTAPIEGRHILLVEDIIDSGTTIHRLADALQGRNPASVELCALLNKNLAPELPIHPRWVGFDAPADFLVGYGLDHAEDYRHLPFVASIAG